MTKLLPVVGFTVPDIVNLLDGRIATAFFKLYDSDIIARVSARYNNNITIAVFVINSGAIYS